MINCKICNFEATYLQSHIKYKHSMSVKEYYKKFSCKKEDVFSIEHIKKMREIGKTNRASERWKIPEIRAQAQHKMKENHWANKIDYTPEKHPRFGTKYPTSWVKGKTKYTDDRIAEYGKKVSAKRTGCTLSLLHRKNIAKGMAESVLWQQIVHSKEFGEKISKAKKGNPKSKKSIEERKRISEKKKGIPLTMEQKIAIANGCKGVGHKKYKYAGISYRSTWEVLFARRLTEQKINFKYEPRVFHGDGVVYMPDFLLVDYGLWIEIKGRPRKSGEIAIEWFAKNNPLIVFRSKEEIQNFAPFTVEAMVQN